MQCQAKFLSTLSLRRATYLVRGQHPNWRISIHALLAESDLIHPLLCNAKPNFYPRSPCGERPLAPEENPTQKRISIHALLAESDNARPDIRRPCAISIHALLAESDAVTTLEGGSLRDFYPRSPCGERRTSVCMCITWPIFLSTLSLRRATIVSTPRAKSARHFYPRSPCGERPLESWPDSEMRKISIHALLAESDLLIINDTSDKKRFLSTLSLRRATKAELKAIADRYISIHALLAESDKDCRRLNRQIL